MSTYHISGLSEEFASEVRRSLRSPEYGHPVVREVATGTGPCRVCLRLFEVGHDQRLLFTYRPASHAGTVGAPGPVVIHVEDCGQYRDDSFPPALHSLPVILEARTGDNRSPGAVHVAGADANAALAKLFADADVACVDVRHGVAGCHIVRVTRADPALSAAAPGAG